MTTDIDETAVLHQWSVRKVPPIVLLYMAAVFIGMMLLAYFVVHSPAAVKALALTAVGAMVPLVPTVISRVEYRLTERELERRPLTKNDPKPFKRVFQLDELSHVVPVRHGFKFYNPLSDSNALRRFWKLHVSDAYSGEVHAEADDQKKVLEILSQHGVPC